MVNFAGLLLLLHVWTQMQKRKKKKPKQHVLINSLRVVMEDISVTLTIIWKRLNCARLNALAIVFLLMTNIESITVFISTAKTNWPVSTEVFSGGSGYDLPGEVIAYPIV